jgi:REP element-mobilizing transposase RayT
VVFIPKRRKKELYGKIRTFLKDLLWIVKRNQGVT